MIGRGSLEIQLKLNRYLGVGGLFTKTTTLFPFPIRHNTHQESHSAIAYNGRQSFVTMYVAAPLCAGKAFCANLGIAPAAPATVKTEKPKVRRHTAPIRYF